MRVPDPERSCAVLIGVGRYRHLPLLNAAGSASRLHDVLTDPHVGALSPRRCALVPPDASCDEVARAIAVAAEDAEDLLLVHYAGHALPGTHGQDLHLTVSDTAPDADRSDSIPFDHVRALVRASRARTKVVLLDCRHPGPSTGWSVDAVLDAVRIEGATVLTTVPPHVDGDDAGWAPAGYPEFTETLVRLLREGVLGAPELLMPFDLHRHLRREMTAVGRRTPRVVGAPTTGEPALSRVGNPAPPPYDHAVPAAPGPSAIEDRVTKLSGPLADDEPIPLAELPDLARSRNPGDRARAYREALRALTDGRVDPAALTGFGPTTTRTPKPRTAPPPPKPSPFSLFLSALAVLTGGPTAAFLLVALYHDLVSARTVEREMGVLSGHLTTGYILISCSVLVVLLTWFLLFRYRAAPADARRTRTRIRVAAARGTVVAGFLASLGAMFAFGVHFPPIAWAALLVEVSILVPFLWIMLTGRRRRWEPSRSE